MSLINDALKKAARLRAEELSELPPMPGGGHRGTSRRGQPMRTQTLVLIGGAAVVLVVVSAVITGILVTGKPEAKAAATPPAKAAVPSPPLAPAPKASTPAPAIVVSVPKVSPPAPTAVPTPIAAPGAQPVAQAKTSPTPAPVAAAAVQESTPASQAPQSHNDMVQAIVDRFRVSGVRAAGADSKALVDGHVYKVNEVIDHTLGLKLVKVDADHLTFVDRDGATYVKAF